MEIEVSATKKINLDKLLEAISLQAEVLDLKANPGRAAEGTVIESKLDRGRGPVATVLVQKGTLKPGDIVVAGAEWGRVRAMLDDKGRQVKVAGPSLPVEILGLSGVPSAGENFVAVEDENQAREISEFRQRKLRDKAAFAQSPAAARWPTCWPASRPACRRKCRRRQGRRAGFRRGDRRDPRQAGQREVKVRVLHSARRPDHREPTSSWPRRPTPWSSPSTSAPPPRRGRWRSATASTSATTRSSTRSSDDIEKMFKSKLAPVARENFLGYAADPAGLRGQEDRQRGGLPRDRGRGEARRRRAAAARRRGHPPGRAFDPAAVQGRCEAKWPTATNAACPSPTTTTSQVDDQIECYETEMVTPY